LSYLVLLPFCQFLAGDRGRLCRFEVDWKVAREKLENVLGVKCKVKVREDQRPEAKDEMEVARVSLTLHSLNKWIERVTDGGKNPETKMNKVKKMVSDNFAVPMGHIPLCLDS
jgi:hypothetical protein